MGGKRVRGEAIERHETRGREQGGWWGESKKDIGEAGRERGVRERGC